MRAVNLLPRDGAQRGRSKPQNVPALVAALTVVLISGLLAMVYLMESGKAKDKRAQLEAAQAELALLPPPGTGRSAAAEQLASQQSPRVQALSTALQHRVAWDRVLREFALVLPSDVWLEDLNAKSPIPPTTDLPAVTAPGTVPTALTIRGFTYSHEAVARLIARLSVIPDLKDVFLVRSTRLGRIVSFTIAADLRTVGATS